MDDNQNIVEEVIMQLDRNENSVLDIPEECRDNIQVIKAKRRNLLIIQKIFNCYKYITHKIVTLHGISWNTYKQLVEKY